MKKSREELVSINAGLAEQVRAKTEELHRAYEDLKGLDKAKNEFLAMISHELRTPLNGIKGYTNLILGLLSPEKGEAPAPEQEDFLEYMRHIDGSADRLVRFSHAASRISQLNSGTHVFDPRPSIWRNWSVQLSNRSPGRRATSHALEVVSLRHRGRSSADRVLSSGRH
ncbi:MAG: histidine kinase dimerization/phospho-acceptor domain-containing protein [Bacteroidales bacterium]